MLSRACAHAVDFSYSPRTWRRLAACSKYSSMSFASARVQVTRRISRPAVVFGARSIAARVAESGPSTGESSATSHAVSARSMVIVMIGSPARGLAEDRHEPAAWARDDFLRVAAPGHVALDMVGPPADHLQVLHPESIELDPRLPATTRTGSTGSGGPGVERNRSTRRAGPRALTRTIGASSRPSSAATRGSPT